MRKSLSLVLPVLIPSWRFFKSIEPSPRIQWAHQSAGTDWREFRPRPKSIMLSQMIFRLFWNPYWNDALFAMSCAERIEQTPDKHSITEIERRILSDLADQGVATADGALQFRLVFVHRDGDGLTEEIVFQSQPFPRSRQAPLDL